MVLNEDILYIILCGKIGINPEKQHKFHPDRKWRFDFAWPDHKVAIELEGGTFGRPVMCDKCGSKVMVHTASGSYPVRAGGRHNSGSGMQADCDKYNSAASLGWFVFRIPTSCRMDNVESVIEMVSNMILKNEVKSGD